MVPTGAGMEQLRTAGRLTTPDSIFAYRATDPAGGHLRVGLLSDRGVGRPAVRAGFERVFGSQTAL